MEFSIVLWVFLAASHFQYYNIHANKRDYLVTNWEPAHISGLEYGKAQEFGVVKKQNDRRQKKQFCSCLVFWQFSNILPLHM